VVEKMWIVLPAVILYDLYTLNLVGLDVQTTAEDPDDSTYYLTN
jgi:hypothetical protein